MSEFSTKENKPLKKGKKGSDGNVRPTIRFFSANSSSDLVLHAEEIQGLGLGFNAEPSKIYAEKNIYSTFTTSHDQAGGQISVVLDPHVVGSKVLNQVSAWFTEVKGKKLVHKGAKAVENSEFDPLLLKLKADAEVDFHLPIKSNDEYISLKIGLFGIFPIGWKLKDISSRNRNNITFILNYDSSKNPFKHFKIDNSKINNSNKSKNNNFI